MKGEGVSVLCSAPAPGRADAPPNHPRQKTNPPKAQKATPPNTRNNPNAAPPLHPPPYASAAEQDLPKEKHPHRIAVHPRPNVHKCEHSLIFWLQVRAHGGHQAPPPVVII